MKDVQEQFGANAAKYLTSAVHSDESDLIRLVELVRPNGGALLDIATGAGHVALAFAPYMDRVIASDPTQKMLDVASAEAEKRGLKNFETALVWAEDMPYSEATFEGVACRMAPHHFKDPRAFVAETHRVLKPGGWFLLADNTGIEDDIQAHQALQDFETRRDPSHVEDYRISQWVTWIEDQGFAIEHQAELKKKLNATDWMNRMQVQEPDRSILIDQIIHSAGALRDYLNPIGEGDSLEFELAETTFLCRKIG